MTLTVQPTNSSCYSGRMATRTRK